MKLNLDILECTLNDAKYNLQNNLMTLDELIEFMEYDAEQLNNDEFMKHSSNVDYLANYETSILKLKAGEEDWCKPWWK